MHMRAFFLTENELCVCADALGGRRAQLLLPTLRRLVLTEGVRQLSGADTLYDHP